MDDTRCYFDIAIEGQDCGRIVFELFHKECPKTCENFRSLCTGKQGKNRNGIALNYKGCPFHRIVRDFMIQGGDITDGNGKGGDSIYDGSFEDENFNLKHDQPYLLSMANRGPDTNRSQFFITTSEAPHLDGKHVVFGRVVSGRDVINKIERQEVDSKSRPLKEVVIQSCGQVHKTDLQSPRQSISGGKKRKQSASSRSSDDLITPRRHSKDYSTSSSRSPSCSSSEASGSSTSRSSHSKRSRHKRASSRSSASSDSGDSLSGSSDDSRNSRSRRRRSRKSNIDSSSESLSSSGAEGRPKKRRKTHRRLVPTEKVEDPESVPDKATDKVESDTFVNPHYKCSVKLDEIPDVPINRFLLRGGPTLDRQPEKDRERDDHRGDETLSLMEVDLSKFEDISDDSDNDKSDKPASVLRSQIKTTESLVSKSGRIMKGRGTFRFRTPSPVDVSRSRNNSHRSRARSPDRYRSNRYHSDRRTHR